jgi:hypothetical protein
MSNISFDSSKEKSSKYSSDDVIITGMGQKKIPLSLSGILIRRHSVPAFRQASNSGKWARMEGQNDNIFLLGVCQI